MEKLNQKLTTEESELLEAFESGRLKSVSKLKLKAEKQRIKKIAIAQGIKNKRVSLRMTEWDFLRIQERALQKGLPYQSLLSSIIHEYLVTT